MTMTAVGRTNVDLAKAAIQKLNAPGTTLGERAIDLAAADLLKVLIGLHRAALLNLELVPQLGDLSALILDVEAP